MRVLPHITTTPFSVFDMLLNNARTVAVDQHKGSKKIKK